MILAILGTALLTASSCSLPQRPRPQASMKRASETTHALYHVSASDEDESAISPSLETPVPGESVIQQLSYEAAATARPVASAAAEEWPAMPPGQVHPYAPPAQHMVDSHFKTASYASEPRISLPTESVSLQHCPPPYGLDCQVPIPAHEAEYFADEYLCDGGDRGLPVHYHGVERAGLETEDTIAEFTDHTGRAHLKPSSRVCIYAPQFASVRSASVPEVSLNVDRAAGAHDGLGQAGLKTKLSPEVGRQNDQPIGLAMRSRVSGLDTDTATNSLEQIAQVVNHVKLINLFEDRSFFRRAELDQTEEAYLAYGLQTAREWTRDRSPIIVASNAAGQEVIARFKAEEYSVAEDRRPPGDLNILKLADVHSAHPGDVVTFTIHYDNVGGRELTEVRIIDNLTPRLELIEKSVKSDREGAFDFPDNGEGSRMIIFELAAPLPGESGGTVTFQARVR